MSLKPIDPHNITDFERSAYDLEKFAVFSVLVAGKTASTIAPRCDSLFKEVRLSPLYWLGSTLTTEALVIVLKQLGIGCYNQKAKTLGDLACKVWFKQLNLATCTPAQLETVPGIAEKTSRFFILHSRPNQRLAALDRHILKGLREYGVENVPDNTPKGKTYLRLEQAFLFIADREGKTPATLDLEWWRKYSDSKSRFQESH
jgi:endonuclease III